MSRLLRPRWQNPASCPSIAAKDRHETRFGVDLAVLAVAQNTFANPQRLRRSAESSLVQGSTIVAMQAVTPFLRAGSLAQTQTYSPRPPRSLPAKRAGAIRLLP